MSGHRKIFTTLSTFIFKAKNNPDFAAAVFIGYGLLAVQVVVQIFLVPLYLQTLGDYRFGALMILLAYIGFAFTLVGSLYSLLLRMFSQAQKSRDGARSSRLYVAAKIITIGFSLICSAVILAIEFFHPILFHNAPPELRDEIIRALLLSTVHLVLLCEISVDQHLLAAAGRQAIANLITLIGLLVFAAAVVPALLSGANLPDVLACFILGDVVSRLFAAFVSRGHVSIRWREPIRRYVEALRDILTSKVRSHFTFTALTVALQADVLIIGGIGGPIAAAKFVLVWKIAEMLILVLSRVTQHLQAEFVGMDLRGERGRLIRIYREVYGGLFVAALCLGILYGLFGRWIVALWVGEGAVPSEAWAYPLAGLAILWLGIARLPITFALSLNRITPLTRVAGVELAAKLLLIYLLFPHSGYLAPMIAISVVHLCGVAYGYYALGRSTLTKLAGVAS